VRTCDEIRELLITEHDPDVCRQKLRDALLSLLKSRSNGAKSLRDVLKEAVSCLKQKPISTGIEEFDTLCGGLYPGTLTVIAGAGGSGKTTLALMLALKLAARKHDCIFFSTSLSSAQIGIRLLSLASGIACSRIRAGDLKNKERKLLKSTLSKLSSLPISVVQKSYVNTADIEATCRSKEAVAFVDQVRTIRQIAALKKLVTRTGRTLICTFDAAELEKVWEWIDLLVLVKKDDNGALSITVQKNPDGRAGAFRLYLEKRAA